MNRITISLPEALTAALQREARRRRVPVSQLVREAVEARLGMDQRGKRRFSFIGIGHSGHGSIAANMEELMKSERILDRDP